MSNIISLIKNSSNFVSLQPASASEIQAAETQLGLLFASDYKEYLLAFGAASFDGKELTGISKSERLSVVSATERARSFYPLLPRSIYVIEELGFDNYFIVQDSSGRVYSYGTSDLGKLIAESLKEYLFTEQIDER